MPPSPPRPLAIPAPVPSPFQRPGRMPFGVHLVGEDRGIFLPTGERADRPRLITVADDGLNGEMSQVAPRLWQGSRPQSWTDLKGVLGVDVLVLATQEHHPADYVFPGVKVLYAELDDSGPPPTETELKEAEAIATLAAARYVRGDRLLITCYMGRNRSGLITALVLMRAHGLSGKQAVRAVRAARPEALSNGHFTRYLERHPPVGPWAWDTEAFRKHPGLLQRVRTFQAVAAQR